ncbi:unnamed protein product [Arctogadus glacialis]
MCRLAQTISKYLQNAHIPDSPYDMVTICGFGLHAAEGVIGVSNKSRIIASQKAQSSNILIIYCTGVMAVPLSKHKAKADVADEEERETRPSLADLPDLKNAAMSAASFAASSSASPALITARCTGTDKNPEKR